MNKVLLAIAFGMIAMVSGGIDSGSEMNTGSVEVRAAQEEIADAVRPEDGKKAQADKITFSCGVAGCTQTEVHQHGLCGIDGCMQIGEHSHGVCGVAGCTQTGEHSHGGDGEGHHRSGHGGGHR